MFSFSDDGLAEMHMANRKLDNRVRQAILFGAGRRLDPRRVLARQVEHQVRERVAARGIAVTGTRHTERFDLLAQGVRIEVKAARWDGVRYECNLRSNDADVLVFGCLDGELHFFVIPFEQVAGRTVIKVTQHDPRDYIGQWMCWFEAWDVIDELVASGRNAWQPELDHV